MPDIDAWTVAATLAALAAAVAAWRLDSHLQRRRAARAARRWVREQRRRKG